MSVSIAVSSPVPLPERQHALGDSTQTMVRNCSPFAKCHANEPENIQILRRDLQALHTRVVHDIHIYPIKSSLRGMLEADLLAPESGQRRLPAALMYDENGLKLWNDCTYLQDYYLTTGEIELMQTWGSEIIRALGSGCAIIDLGSGNLRKIRGLLDQFEETETEVFYFALDLERSDLERCMQSVPSTYRYVHCFGLCGTFEDARLWSMQLDVPKCFLSLGATFGNDLPDRASADLAQWAAVMSPRDLMIIGMDACKDKPKVYRAYNDTTGVWHSLIRNGFSHSNVVLGERWYNAGDWDLFGGFDKHPDRHRFMLRAKRDIHCDALGLHFKAGEGIMTLPSYKYSPQEMYEQFSRAGLVPREVWKAPKQPIYQYLLSVPSKTGRM